MENSINKSIEEKKKKIAAQKKQLEKTQKKVFEKVGKAALKVFGNDIPEKQKDIEDFFRKLKENK